VYVGVTTVIATIPVGKPLLFGAFNTSEESKELDGSAEAAQRESGGAPTADRRPEVRGTFCKNVCLSFVQLALC